MSGRKWKVARRRGEGRDTRLALAHPDHPGDVYMTMGDIQRLTGQRYLDNLAREEEIARQVVRGDELVELWRGIRRLRGRAFVYPVSALVQAIAARIETGGDPSGRLERSARSLHAFISDADADVEEAATDATILHDDATLTGAPVRQIDGARCVAIDYLALRFDDRVELAEGLEKIGAQVTRLYKPSGASARWVALDELARVADTRLLRAIEALPSSPADAAPCSVWRRERPPLEDLSIPERKASRQRIARAVKAAQAVRDYGCDPSEDLDPFKVPIAEAEETRVEEPTEPPPASNVVEIRRREPAELIAASITPSARPPVRIDRRLLPSARAVETPVEEHARGEAVSDHAQMVLEGLRRLQSRGDVSRAEVDQIAGQVSRLTTHQQRLELQASTQARRIDRLERLVISLARAVLAALEDDARAERVG